MFSVRFHCSVAKFAKAAIWIQENASRSFVEAETLPATPGGGLPYKMDGDARRKF